METVWLQAFHLLVGAGGHDGFPPPLTAQGVGAGTEQNPQAVLLWNPVQEPTQGPVALVLIAAVGSGDSLGAGQDVLGAQGAALLVQAAVLRRLQAVVLLIQLHEGGSWENVEESSRKTEH